MGKTLSVSGRQALDSLAPDARLAVELYTNPMYGETFGNLTRAAAAAGLGTTKAIRTPEARAAIMFLQQQRDDQADNVRNILSRFSMDAAYKLVKMLSGDLIDGKPMKVLDPTKLIEDGASVVMGTDKKGNQIIVGYDESNLKQAREMTMHNRAMASLMKEARAIINTILEFHLGPPGKGVEKGHGEEDPLDLGKLSLEELQALMRQVESVKRQREDEQPQVVKAEVQQETPEPEGPSAPAGGGAKKGLPF